MVGSAYHRVLNMVQKVGAKLRSEASSRAQHSTLHHLLALCTSHGDFSWYHRKFSHTDASLTCSYGQPKTPEHIVSCCKTKVEFRFWPQKPQTFPRASARLNLAIFASGNVLENLYLHDSLRKAEGSLATQLPNLVAKHR